MILDLQWVDFSMNDSIRLFGSIHFCAIVSLIDLGLLAIVIPSDEEVAERKKELSRYGNIKDGVPTPIPLSEMTDLDEASSITITKKEENGKTSQPPLTIWNLVLYREVAVVLWLTLLDSAVFSGCRTHLLESDLSSQFYPLFLSGLC
jgi:hypothetical protein